MIATASLGYSVLSKPHVAWLQVPVDDAPAVRELQAATGFLSYVDGLFEGEPVVGASSMTPSTSPPPIQ